MIMQAPGSRRVRTAEAMGGSSRHRLAARTKVRKPTASAPGVVGGVVVVTPGALAGHTTQPTSTQAPTGHPAVGCQPGRLCWVGPRVALPCSLPCPALVAAEVIARDGVRVMRAGPPCLPTTTKQADLCSPSPASLPRRVGWVG